MKEELRFRRRREPDSDDLLIKIVAAILIVLSIWWIAKKAIGLSDAIDAQKAYVAAQAQAQQEASRLALVADLARRARLEAIAQESLRLRSEQAQQTYYKCEGSNGTIFQSQPCGESVANLPYQSNRDRYSQAEEAQRQANIARNEAEVARYARMYGGSAAQASAAPSQAVGNMRTQRFLCQQAKDYRDAVLKQVGLNRTFDLLRQLNDQVYEACKDT